LSTITLPVGDVAVIREGHNVESVKKLRFWVGDSKLDNSMQPRMDSVVNGHPPSTNGDLNDLLASVAILAGSFAAI
jgi:hypothetical protein